MGTLERGVQFNLPHPGLVTARLAESRNHLNRSTLNSALREGCETCTWI